MTSMLCLPPKIIDHSFPKSENELQTIAICIGYIEEYCINGQTLIVTLQSLDDYLESFSWDECSSYPLLQDIYINLMKLISDRGEYTVRVNLASINDYELHPLPPGCDNLGVPEIWQSEVGQLLKAHDQCTAGNNFFIGIACDNAFAQHPPTKANGYSGLSGRAFPIVGPLELSQLIDGFTWQVLDGDIAGTISVADAAANVHLIGGKIVGQTASHIKVEFAGARPWILDPNVDPQPERFLKQLVDKSGYPYQVVRYALKHGKLPDLQCRLGKYCI